MAETEMRFSELTGASLLEDTDIAAIAKIDANSASGYMSYSATLYAIAVYVTKLATYSADLQTTDKHIIGAINELKNLVSLIPRFSIQVVEQLPTQDISDTTIYLVPSSDPEQGNYYEEYIYITVGTSHQWELVGTTAVDLSDYYTKSQVDGYLANKVDKVAGKGLSTNDYTTAEKTKLAGIESGAQVNKTGLDNVAGKVTVSDNVIATDTAPFVYRQTPTVANAGKYMKEQLFLY